MLREEEVIMVLDALCVVQTRQQQMLTIVWMALPVHPVHGVHRVTQDWLPPGPKVIGVEEVAVDYEDTEVNKDHKEFRLLYKPLLTVC